VDVNATTMRDLSVASSILFFTYPANKRMLANIQKHSVWLDRAIAQLEKEMDDQIRHDKATLLGEVKSVGDQTLRSVIIGIPELGSLNRKQIAAADRTGADQS
jgi:hypothetical protein